MTAVPPRPAAGDPDFPYMLADTPEEFERVRAFAGRAAPDVTGEDVLREVLRIHHPIMRSETGPFSGCRCGAVKLGQDVIQHVFAELRSALDGVVYVDGLGVSPDQPLPAGTRIRFRIDTDDPGRDLTAHVAGGQLHVDGFRHRVTVEPVSPARVTIRTTP